MSGGNDGGSGSADVGSDTGSGANGTSTGATVEPPRECASVCESAADCCRGDPECPGPHPNNLRCETGRCVDDGCTNDVECDFGDPFILTCVELIDRWSPTCALLCDVEADCSFFNGTSCTGVTADGGGYCEFGPQCERNSDCGGVGICDVAFGRCVCHDDIDCGEGRVCSP